MPEIEQDSYKSRAMSIIEAYGFVPNPAHKAVEAKPPVLWNKGMDCLSALFVFRLVVK